MSENMFEEGARMAAEERSRCGSIAVRYKRGADSAELRAGFGSTVFQLEQNDGSFLAVESRDYYIEATDLVLGGAAVKPEPADRIEEAKADATYVYEVAAYGSEPCWKWHDGSKVSIRVHTKLIQAVPA